jgi:hypothetical protein
MGFEPRSTCQVNRLSDPLLEISGYSRVGKEIDASIGVQVDQHIHVAARTMIAAGHRSKYGSVYHPPVPELPFMLPEHAKRLRQEIHAINLRNPPQGGT